LRFDFRLRDLDQVEPWGEGEDRHLSWFGLTDGEYWIEAGGATLFEWRTDEGLFRMDYQVSRLHEDLLGIVARALEPVPGEIALLVGSDGGWSWVDEVTAWRTAHPDASREADETHGLALGWLSDRSLDTLYLVGGPWIVFWSEGGSVHVSWTGRGNRHWTAGEGAHSVSRDDFVAAVRDFDERLMSAMGARAAAVRAGAFPAQVRLLGDPVAEHVERATRLERTLARRVEPTDWAPVRAAIEVVRGGVDPDAGCR
jgi:hypothetical protein